MDKREFAFEEDGLTGSVIDDDVWVCFCNNLIVLCVIVPYPQLCHLYRIFGDICFVLHLSGKVEVDVTVHGRVDLRHDDALYAVGDFGALMLEGGHALDDGLTMRVRVQAREEFGLGDVVRLDDGFLSVRVRDVFTQHTNRAGFHHVGMQAVVDDELDEGGVVDQRPGGRHGKHLVGIAVEPLVIEGASQCGDFGLFAWVNGCTSVNGKACGFR